MSSPIRKIEIGIEMFAKRNGMTRIPPRKGGRNESLNLTEPPWEQQNPPRPDPRRIIRVTLTVAATEDHWIQTTLASRSSTGSTTTEVPTTRQPVGGSRPRLNNTPGTSVAEKTSILSWGHATRRPGGSIDPASPRTVINEKAGIINELTDDRPTAGDGMKRLTSLGGWQIAIYEFDGKAPTEKERRQTRRGRSVGNLGREARADRIRRRENAGKAK